jgi:16S rRNA (cytosine1402-N4)-methyltransferase
MHRSICVPEILEILQIKPGQIGLDATLGYGGHSVAMIKCLLPNGKLYATDVDPYELPKTRERLAALGYTEDVVVIKKMNFSGINQIVTESGLLNFVLADLGVSSMQIDNPDRGFSFKVDGPLDLRLNPTSGKSAAMLLKKITQHELEELLFNHSDEPYAAQIATTIMGYKASGIEIKTTKQLQEMIENALVFLPKENRKEEIKKACQRCFQALRIEVNNEFGVLDDFLEKLPEALAEGGRVAILTFHSGEDRRVKKSFQRFFRDGIYTEIADQPIRASAAECITNPRAKSAKLRWAVKG